MRPISGEILPCSEIRRDVNGLHQNLAEALLDLLRKPVTSLVAGFNWKTAAISAMLRAIMFFFTNLRAGHILALKATLVERATPLSQWESSARLPSVSDTRALPGSLA